MNYEEYSLSQLEDWMGDLLSNNEVSPQDIFNTIKKSVNDTYEYHKHQSSRSYELLGLLNGYDRGVAAEEIADEKSKYWYDYDRNDPNRENPFISKLKENLNGAE
tara:strand:- start:113 stop:427 length:315 start_codon:yes stop_codon:yes gene_type:complete